MEKGESCSAYQDIRTPGTSAAAEVAAAVLHLISQAMGWTHTEEEVPMEEAVV